MPTAPVHKEEEYIDKSCYENALAQLQSGSHPIFITGQAGTGKSTFIKYLHRHVDAGIPVIAPTGVAALNVRGQTIHSFFQFPPRIIEHSEVALLRNRRLFKELKILIIDEISMVRADLMDLIDISLRKNTGRVDQPFGGVRLVLVGDLFQLPPVVASQQEASYIYSRFTTPYFLSSSCMQSAQTQIIELTKIFRQKDIRFIRILSDIREGKNIDEAISQLNRICFTKERDREGEIILTPDNATAGRINEERLSELGGKEYRYEGVVTGKFGVTNDRLPAPKVLRLKHGARVMFTKNDKDHRWVNGTIATVKGLSERSITVSVGKRIYAVDREIWESVRYRYDEFEDRITAQVVATYRQFPLVLAWAVTIHKSQGKTFDKVHIDTANGIFADGQLYVALSRCRTIDGISLHKPLRVQDVKVNAYIKELHGLIRKN